MTRAPDQVRDISVEVYKKLLAMDAGGNDPAHRAKEWERMVAKDGDGGKKFRERASFYDRIVKIVLEVIDG